jgi:hypothetical protein
MINVADAVVTSCWPEKKFDPSDLSWVEEMSESDWDNANIGHPYGRPSNELIDAAEHASTLLAIDGPLWPAVMREVRRLIRESQPFARNSCHNPASGVA